MHGDSRVALLMQVSIEPATLAVADGPQLIIKKKTPCIPLTEDETIGP